MIKQVWGCKNEKHDFRYEAPVSITELYCPMGHIGVLLEGDPVVLKPKRKRAKIQKAPKVTDRRSKVEKALDDLKRTDGKIVAEKVTLF